MQSRQRLAEGGLLLCLLGVIGLCALHPIYAVDFFWHLKLGELIRDTGQIPRTDLFSPVDPSRPYVQFNWLWEWMAATVVHHYGLHGMRIAQCGVMVASFAGFYWVVRSRLQRADFAFACTALGFALFEDRFQERPASLAFGLTAALCPWLLDRQRRTGWQSTLGVALLGLVWSNLHGGESLLLPLSFFALWVGAAFDRRRGRVPAAGSPLTAASWLGVSLVALCISPTFLSGLRHWTEAIGPQVSAGNEEWQPTYTMLRNGLRPSFVLIALAPTLVGVAYVAQCVGRVRRAGWEALDGGETLLAGGYLILAQASVRNAFLCVLPLLFVLQHLAASEAATRWRRLAQLAGLALVLIAAEDALPYAYGGSARIRPLLALDLAPTAFPELSADFVQQAQLEGAIVNDGRFGGYLIWRLWPRCSVFADSRHHFTPAIWPVFVATHDPLRRTPGLDEAYRRWRTDLVMFRGPTFPLGAPARFRLLYKAGDQEVYQDLRGPHASANLARTHAWLARQHVAPLAAADAPQIPALALQLGAARYLDQPYQRLRAREAAQRQASRDPANVGAGLLERGQLDYEAGFYAVAADDFERALKLLPRDPAAAYPAALSHFAAGHASRALELVTDLLRAGSGVDERKLRKLQLLQALLAARAPVAGPERVQ